MKSFFSFIWETLKIVVLAMIIVVPIRYFLFQPFLVKGQSMEPNFEDGDYLIIDEITYRFQEPQRGEVIVFKYPPNPSQRFIKRIIGLPEETVEIKDGKIKISKDGKEEFLNEKEYLFSNYINKEEEIKIALGEKDYFVLGDNRNFSFDSRRFGVLPRDKIIGRVILRLWPLASVSTVIVPSY